MISRLLCAIFLIISFAPTSYGQKHGSFLGKKNYLDVTTVSHLSLLHFALSDQGLNSFGGYKEKDGVLVSKGIMKVNTGVHFRYGRIIRPRLSIGLEFGIDFWKLKPGEISIPYGDPNIGNSARARHERISMIRTLYMPVVELGGRRGLFPTGITQVFGFGFSSIKLIRKDYLMELDLENYNVWPEYIDSIELRTEDHFDYTQKYNGLHLLYGIKYRAPLTRYLFFNVGIRAMIDIRLYDLFAIKSDSFAENTEFYTRHDIKKQTSRNFLSLDAGLTLVF